MRGGRTVAAVGVAAAVAAFVALSVQVWRAQRDPSGFSDANDGPIAWMAGPQAPDLTAAGDREIEAGLATLNDTSLEGATRLARYRERLEKAEVLFERSLRAQPGQPRVVARLAALRWELDPPLTDDAVRATLDRIAVASAMAPRDHDVQDTLGRLLYRMGRAGEAWGYLAKATQLHPPAGAGIVAFLRENLVPADEIAANLPLVPEVLVAVYPAFRDEDRALAWLDLVEPRLAASGARVLRTYAGACLRLNVPDRARTRLGSIGPLADRADEAERLAQRAAAGAAAGQPEAALPDAAAARVLQPESPQVAEIYGRVALAAGRTDDALKAFREALSMAARQGSAPEYRAWLYVQVGQAEDRQGRPDLAFDDYKRALSLDPTRQDARRRLDAMKGAAGLGN